MFVLDLFNTKYEKALRAGAVDKVVSEGGPYDLPGKDYPRPGDAPRRPRPSGSTTSRRHDDDPDFMDPDQRRLRADQERVRKANAEYQAKKKPGMAEGNGRDLTNTPRDQFISRMTPSMDANALRQKVAKIVNSPGFTEDTILQIVDAGDNLSHPAGRYIQQAFYGLQYNLGKEYEDYPERVAEKLLSQFRSMLPAYRVAEDYRDSPRAGIDPDFDSLLLRRDARRKGMTVAQYKHYLATQDQDREYELTIGPAARAELKRQADEIAELKRQQLRQERLEDEAAAHQRYTEKAEREMEMEKIRKAYQHELNVINNKHTNSLQTLNAENSHDIRKLSIQQQHELTMLKANQPERPTRPQRPGRPQRPTAEPEDDFEPEPEISVKPAPMTSNKPSIGNANFDSETGKPLKPQQWHTSQQLPYKKPPALGYKNDDDVTDIEPKKLGETGIDRAVNDKGLTQQRWLQLVQTKFPDAKIVCAKMIDGPCRATLPDGKTLSWVKVDQGTDGNNNSTGGVKPVGTGKYKALQTGIDQRKAARDKMQAYVATLPTYTRKGVKESTGQDSKSWMASIQQQHPDVKFIQAKMPGAPIMAMVNGKPVAQFDTKKGMAEGAAISGNGGAVDNCKQQMANRTELAYQKGMAEARKKKKKKSSRSMQGYFFPGYGYYGGGDSGEGGGGEGGESVNEFAAGGGGDAGNYFQALASAWYNGAFDTGSLQKGIKSKEDVERLLNRGIVCPDGKTRKLHIDYNSDFDGVEIYSDDYYEYGDYDDTIDSRTGQKWGPYDFMAFSDEQLDEGLLGFIANKKPELKKKSEPVDPMVAKIVSNRLNPQSRVPQAKAKVYHGYDEYNRAKAVGDVEESTVNELSTDKLAQYKTAAGADASAADKRGDYERGDKRFSGIVKATKKQFANDLKKHGQQGMAEGSSTSSDAVERAILNRIMVSHTNLLMRFGPDKVMQAAEEVAYNVGDVDEIGTSDVSAYVNQVRQILGA